MAKPSYLNLLSVLEVSTMLRWLRAGLVLLGIPVLAIPAIACPLCTPGPVLRKDFDRAKMVLFGKFTNPRLPRGNDPRGGTSDFVIEKVLKGSKILGDREVLTLPRYIPQTKSKFLVFCNFLKDKVDPYRGVEVIKGGDIVRYLKGNLAIDDKLVAARLQFCFQYLDNPEMEIALDAYREFARADYKVCRSLARKLPPDKIDKLAGWLQSPKTASYRLGLYALLLGDCGNDKHAALLRRLLDKPKRTSSGVDGMLVAYTILKPKPGWAYIRDRVLGQAQIDFQLRHAGLRAARFFWENRRDVVPRKDLLQGVCLLLDQPDMADIVIEDLRKWHCWQVCDKVLALAKKESHDVRMIRRNLLRYALTCPSKYPKAAEFVRRERKKDREWVAEIEDQLKLDIDEPSR
jgi:hypothetical protein